MNSRNIYYHIKDKFKDFKTYLENTNTITNDLNSFTINISNDDIILNNEFPFQPITHMSHYIENGKHIKEYQNKGINDTKISFNRKITRFLNYLESDNKILFVFFNNTYITTPSLRNNDSMYEYIKKLDYLLQDSYPKLNYNIFYIDSYKKRGDSESNIYLDNNIINYYVHLEDHLLCDASKNLNKARKSKSIYINKFRLALNDFLLQTLTSNK